MRFEPPLVCRYGPPWPGGARMIQDAQMTFRDIALLLSPRASGPRWPGDRAFVRFALALLVAGTTTLATAQERSQQPRRQPPSTTEQRPADQRAAGEREGLLRLLPPDSVTEHTLALPGRALT